MPLVDYWYELVPPSRQCFVVESSLHHLLYQDGVFVDWEMKRGDQCEKGSQLRPHIVWFGESLWEEDLRRCDQAIRSCDLLLVIGTSGVVYPAAGFASVAKTVGALVIEINLESTPQSNLVDLSLQGRAKDIVPQLL